MIASLKPVTLANDSPPEPEAPSQSVSIMAAMLAHEIKNPLAGIRGAAQLLGQHANAEDKALTELICREVDRIHALTRKIEFFSAEPIACNQQVNIHEVLQYVRDLARRSFARGIHIESRYDPSLPEVVGDKELLIQLFVNLITNAAEALNGHSEATITLRTRYQINHKFRMKGHKPFISLPICIEIEDNGGGISPDIGHRLFEPFTTTKATGKGLGLAIVAKIVADHGGMISLDPSAPEGNARFKILLPGI
jgi:two-component system nitrogen regulation sensor histidine kinase GlnL